MAYLAYRISSSSNYATLRSTVFFNTALTNLTLHVSSVVHRTYVIQVCCGIPEWPIFWVELAPKVVPSYRGG